MSWMETEIGRRDWGTAAHYTRLLREKVALTPLTDVRAPVQAREPVLIETVCAWSRRETNTRAGWTKTHFSLIVGTPHRLLVEDRHWGWLSFPLHQLERITTTFGASQWQARITFGPRRPAQSQLRFRDTTAPLVAAHVAAFGNPNDWLLEPGIASLAATPPDEPLNRQAQSPPYGTRIAHPGA